VRNKVLPTLTKGKIQASYLTIQVFRDANGSSVDLGLTLSLKDFLCKDIVDKISDFEDQQLVISSELLCEAYDHALAVHLKAEKLEERNKQFLAKAAQAKQAADDVQRKSARNLFGLRPRPSAKAQSRQTSVGGGPLKPGTLQATPGGVRAPEAQRPGILQPRTGRASLSGANTGMTPVEGRPQRSSRSEAVASMAGPSGSNT
jgi:hypothetical protein